MDARRKAEISADLGDTVVKNTDLRCDGKEGDEASKGAR